MDNRNKKVLQAEVLEAVGSSSRDTPNLEAASSYQRFMFRRPQAATPEPVVLDDFKSTRFQKHEVGARAFPTPG